LSGAPETLAPEPPDPREPPHRSTTASTR